jgi:hypothetical protein
MIRLLKRKTSQQPKKEVRLTGLKKLHKECAALQELGRKASEDELKRLQDEALELRRTYFASAEWLRFQAEELAARDLMQKQYLATLPKTKTKKGSKK